MPSPAIIVLEDGAAFPGEALAGLGTVGGEIALVVNTPFGRGARSDGYEIRATALRKGVPSISTLAGASAAVSAIESARRPRVQVHCLQDLHRAAEAE